MSRIEHYLEQTQNLEKDLSDKLICQTCGICLPKTLIVIPFGASQTWICLDCMAAVNSRIRYGNKRYHSLSQRLKRWLRG